MIRIYGDLMLDRWVYGDTERISPEAPVPVLLQKNVRENLGGAGNVAANLRSLGIPSFLYGVVANDSSGDKVKSLLETMGIHFHLHQSLRTTTKTRLISNNKHIVRIDDEQFFKSDTILTSFVNSIDDGDIVLVSDYAKGLVSPNTIKTILQRTNKIMVDPKHSPEFYKNAWLVKPNRHEFENWVGEFSEDSARRLMRENQWEWMVVTLGKDGVYVLNKNSESKHFKEEVHDVADVSGAGDTVFAVLAYCVSNGMDVFRAAEYACRAASRVVSRSGVALVTTSDLAKDTVFTNGCFDILHEGHFHLFKECQKLGKKIVVGLNSDRSVRELKGDSRPINDQHDRRKALLDLGIFHDVIIFDEHTPLELIRKLRPDVIVKGGDYSMSDVVGKEISAVVLVEYLDGHSTTKIIGEM